MRMTALSFPWFGTRTGWIWFVLSRNRRIDMLPIKDIFQHYVPNSEETDAIRCGKCGRCRKGHGKTTERPLLEAKRSFHCFLPYHVCIKHISFFWGITQKTMKGVSVSLNDQVNVLYMMLFTWDKARLEQLGSSEWIWRGKDRSVTKAETVLKQGMPLPYCPERGW